MIRYEYKVMKSFCLDNNEEGIDRIAPSDALNRDGADFQKGALYVDYEIPEESIIQGKLTLTLIKKNYIKLVKKVTKDGEI